MGLNWFVFLFLSLPPPSVIVVQEKCKVSSLLSFPQFTSITYRIIHLVMAPLHSCKNLTGKHVQFKSSTVL